MGPLVAWGIAFLALAITAHRLWARMVSSLRQHSIAFIDVGYQLDALAKYTRFVRDGRADADERRLLWLVWGSMALSWLAFLGLLFFGLRTS